MKRSAVIDMSAFIWDVTHFNINKPGYYNLMQVLPNLYEGLIKYKVPIIMRRQLINEISTYFPYDLIPRDYYAFELSTLTFFSQIFPFLKEYEAANNSHISSKPSLTKTHYKPSTNVEMRYLITYLHVDQVQTKKFLTFDIMWHDGKYLETHFTEKRVIETIICDEIELHENILKYFKKIFKHNPKHNANNLDDYISALSCYNDRLGDTTEAQKLLDKSIKYKESYYSFDSDHEVYVKFVRTNSNVYHGYDVQLSEEDLKKIRKTFNK